MFNFLRKCPTCPVTLMYKIQNINHSLFLKIILFIYFWAVLGLCGCTVFSLVAASGGYSLVGVLGLLTEVASLVVEHRL